MRCLILALLLALPLSAQEPKAVTLPWASVPKLGDKDAESKNAKLRKAYGGKLVVVDGMVENVRDESDGRVTASIVSKRKGANNIVWPVTIYGDFTGRTSKELRDAIVRAKACRVTGTLRKDAGKGEPIWLDDAKLVGVK